MEEATPNENINVSGENGDQFPKGLRVLVVDDNVTYLQLLEKMLHDCSYRVTKCQRGEDALSMIRENKGGFDIVLTTVHMPGMDGLQLLAEIIDMGITLPVVMFSSDAVKETVVKGVKGGACGFLVKPIQINTLKILWQHVLRSNPSSSNNSTKELEMPHAPTTSSSNNTHTQVETEEENSEILKRSSEDENDDGQNTRAKKPRVLWTPELHQNFLMAVSSLGNDNAKPKKILQTMRKMTGVPHNLTRQNISSHLQKHRINSVKIGEASEHQNAQPSLISRPGFTNQTHSTPSSSLIECGSVQNYATSTQYSSQDMNIAPQQPYPGCSMRMPDLVELPDNNALPRYQMGLQSQQLALLQQPNPPLQHYGCQQQVNESAPCPSYVRAPSVGFTSPMNSTYPVLHKQSHNSLIMQMSPAPSNIQILDEAAAARHYLSASTHTPHPLQSQILTHDIPNVNSSTPHPASEGWNNYKPVVEHCQVYSNEAVLADMLDANFFEDLGFGKEVPYLDSYIQNNGAM